MRSKLIDRRPTGISYKNFSPLMHELMNVFADYACDVFLLNTLDVIFERNKYASGKLFESIDYSRYVRGGKNPLISVTLKDSKLVDYWDKVNKGSSSESDVQINDLLQWIKDKRKFMKAPKKERARIFKERSKLKRTQDINIEMDELGDDIVHKWKHGWYSGGLRKNPLSFYKFTASGGARKMGDREAAAILKERIEKGGIHSSLYAFMGVKKEKPSEMATYEATLKGTMSSMKPIYHKHHTQMSTEIRKRNRKWFKKKKDIAEKEIREGIASDELLKEYKKSIIVSLNIYLSSLVEQLFSVLERARTGKKTSIRFIRDTTEEQMKGYMKKSIKLTDKVVSETVSNRVMKQFSNIGELFIGFLTDRLNSIYKGDRGMKEKFTKTGMTKDTVNVLIRKSLSKIGVSEEEIKSISEFYSKMLKLSTEDIASVLKEIEKAIDTGMTPKEMYNSAPDWIKEMIRKPKESEWKNRQKQNLKGIKKSLNNMKKKQKKITSKYKTGKTLKISDTGLSPKELNNKLGEIQKNWKNINWNVFKSFSSAIKNKQQIVNEMDKVHSEILGKYRGKGSFLRSQSEKRIYMNRLKKAKKMANNLKNQIVSNNINIIKNLGINVTINEIRDKSIDLTEMFAREILVEDYGLLRQNKICIMALMRRESKQEQQLLHYGLDDYFDNFSKVVAWSSGQLLDGLSLDKQIIKKRAKRLEKTFSKGDKKLRDSLQTLGSKILNENIKEITNILKV